jgi:hypothetical protein
VKIRNIAFAALPLLFVLPCFGQPTPRPARSAIELQKPNYTITITPPSAPLSLNSPLLVEVFFTNTTTSDIYMEEEYCKTCSPLQIMFTKDGKEVDTTPLQRVRTGRASSVDMKMYSRTNANSLARRHRPGVFWKFNLDLRTLYNITESGQYVLTASRTEKTKDGEVVVSSNAVTLNIVP